MTFKHGFSAYQNGRCRCDECRKDANQYQKAIRAKRHQQTRESGLPDHVPHGQSAYTNWGCRCDVCKAAQSAKNAEWKEKRPNQ